MNQTLSCSEAVFPAVGLEAFYRSHMDPPPTTKDWDTLARADPLWAVYVAPGTRGGGWDRSAFLATGRAEVNRVMTRVIRLAPELKRGRALDFGCGVGRLTLALSEHFDRVTGVDASPVMLSGARELVGDKCTLVLNQEPDLARFDSGSFDLAYSSLVLQHLPRANALRYLGELVRVTRGDGCVVVQVASRPGWSPKGMIFRFAPRWLIRLGQRRLLGYPAPMLMTALSEEQIRSTVASVGGVVLAAEDDPSYGGHWHYTRYYVRPSVDQPS